MRTDARRHLLALSVDDVVQPVRHDGDSDEGLQVVAEHPVWILALNEGHGAKFVGGERGGDVERATDAAAAQAKR
jgi:hypothetical protein